MTKQTFKQELVHQLDAMFPNEYKIVETVNPETLEYSMTVTVRNQPFSIDNELLDNLHVFHKVNPVNEITDGINNFFNGPVV